MFFLIEMNLMVIISGRIVVFFKFLFVSMLLLMEFVPTVASLSVTYRCWAIGLKQRLVQ